jgi:very-short-patch-repair endonuclease
MHYYSVFNMDKSKWRHGHRRHVSAEKKEFARELRRNPTPSQSRLWQELRGRNLGWRFRRRAILYGWIVDFWCPAARLVIEIDHASDSERRAEHAHRDSVLAGYGIQAVRVDADRVFQDLDEVLNEIRIALDSMSNYNTEQPGDLGAE